MSLNIIDNFAGRLRHAASFVDRVGRLNMSNVPIAIAAGTTGLGALYLGARMLLDPKKPQKEDEEHGHHQHHNRTLLDQLLLLIVTTTSFVTALRYSGLIEALNRSLQRE